MRPFTPYSNGVERAAGAYRWALLQPLTMVIASRNCAFGNANSGSPFLGGLTSNDVSVKQIFQDFRERLPTTFL